MDSVPAEDATCATCVFAKPHTREGYVVCKRYPPEPLKAGMHGAPQNLIRDSDWCGEHPDRRV